MDINTQEAQQTLSKVNPETHRKTHYIQTFKRQRQRKRILKPAREKQTDPYKSHI